MSDRNEADAARRPETVTPERLRAWGLPDPGDDKKARGDVVVVGGSRRTPGGVMLAGEAALRVGAGRLGVFAPGSIDAQLGAVLPEAAVYALPDDASDAFDDSARNTLARADAVLVGPGFDDADETRDTLLAIADARPRCLVLDAYALGVLPGIDRGLLPDALVLTPNRDELAILRDGEPGADLRDDLAPVVAEVAQRYRAVVTCYDVVAASDGATWRIHGGGPGLATSGSGDVLSGAIAGFAARGTGLAQAAVWGSWVHARAGDRLTERLGLGFLARELAAELPLALREVS
ncbi:MULTISPECIES: NAD(P)H-hydrate dehydratase [Microbacterium]|uniref:ADP-dependent (S)-NAD(P)H-hydrate dehydratase n=1 Tax=Microbacterium wangchenii TaxID=2541726 RepID=A0ABX5SQW7_9MICO|nr:MULTISPECIES: NAD(P)H-hydrate dehydratase [Microbacterium]MCK6065071.1 NAD(P)H-hydrate dehydratase [Microbacterium sp. EYE_512]QBR88533.1 NAD(P)H-hydrate dehydratase [Microbacterium wangchenii]TFV82412.1 NAD(P)H-hydrate dehydratase [Microbacterium sp. dk485]TXK20260.1 NAD(P)H-hydrate dehydratase [Microbacterium wangchenii]